MEAIAATREPVYPNRNPDKRPWPIGDVILFGEQLNPLNLVGSQQSQAKGPRYFARE